jgi:hypothetical protein
VAGALIYWNARVFLLEFWQRIFVMSDFYPIEARRAKDDRTGRRNVPAWRLTGLPAKYSTVIDLMVHGHIESATIEGVFIEAGQPMTLRQAARAAGVRLRQAREVSDTELFAKALNRAVQARRNSERPRSLQTAIEIRDDEGDRSAATKTVRLKAIDSIEGKSSSGTNVQVNVNQHTNLTAGYVIRIPTTDPPVIDGDVLDPDE